ncbi:MAG: DsbC family protein [Deltaproteobacteria bacterium]
MMIKRYFMPLVFLSVFMLSALTTDQGFAFQGPGCTGTCTECHSLTKDEASKLLKADKFQALIKDVRMGPVKGLWEVEFSKGDKSGVVYIDFLKKFLVEANFTPLEKLAEEPKPLRKVDIGKIPLDKAVVLGDPKAEKKVIVFDDPECTYCAKLHEEIKKIIEKRKDVAFLIKLFPLNMHPGAYEKSKSIICGEKPATLLDDAFAGKKLPRAACAAQEIDNNIKLAKELGITGTPAVIFPDGRLMPGYAPADTLLNFLDNPQ